MSAQENDWVVEDSEPEREMQRRDARRKRRAARRSSNSAIQHSKRPLWRDPQSVESQSSSSGEGSMRDEDGLPRLDLSHFAFSDSKASGSQEHSPVVKTTPPATSATRPAAATPPNLHRLLNCVVCGSKWISNKTTVQKMAHMSKCSRKKQLSHKELEYLIGEAMQSADTGEMPLMNGSQHNVKRKPYISEVPTLMNGYIDSGATVKGKRKAANVINVQPAVDAQEYIRKNAALLFDEQIENSDPYLDDIPATQCFGQSYLGNQFKGDANEQGPLVDPLAHYLSQVTLAESPCDFAGGVMTMQATSHIKSYDDGQPTLGKSIATEDKPDKIRKRTSKKAKRVTAEEVEAFVEAYIQSDQERHLRVLRLEPLTFGDIMQEALHSGLPELGLAVKLKACLDEQGVNIVDRNGGFFGFA